MITIKEAIEIIEAAEVMDKASTSVPNAEALELAVVALKKELENE